MTDDFCGSELQDRSNPLLVFSNSPEEHLQRSIYCLRKGELAKARLFARTSADFASSDWSRLDDLGFILFRLGELRLSFAVLQQAGRNNQLKKHGLRVLSALYHFQGQNDQSRLCINAMAMLGTITGPKKIKPECPNVLHLCSVEQSVFVIKKDPETGLCSDILKGGHFSLKYLLNSQQVNLFTGIVLGDNLLQTDDLPRFDLIINGLSCPDFDEKGLGSIYRLLRRFPHIPVINPPESVLRTSRAENVRRLSGLDHVIIPPIELVECGQGLDRVISQVESAGFCYPLVLRRRGGHGANQIHKIDSRFELEEWFTHQDQHQVFYVSPYFHYCWGDGLFRKFRVFFIDGLIYPASCVVSDCWQIHCDNPRHRDRYRLMSSRITLQDEEKVFLNDPASSIGSNALNALWEIQRLIGLDYFGIDFALSESGKIIIFEVNAAMRQNIADIKDFPYLRPSVDRMTNAFMTMVQSRCS